MYVTTPTFISGYNSYSTCTCIIIVMYIVAMVIENQLASAPTNGSVVLWDIKKNTKSKLGEGVAWNKRGVVCQSGHGFKVPLTVLKLLFSSFFSSSLSPSHSPFPLSPLLSPHSPPPSLPLSPFPPSPFSPCPPPLPLSSSCLRQDTSES